MSRKAKAVFDVLTDNKEVLVCSRPTASSTWSPKFHGTVVATDEAGEFVLVRKHQNWWWQWWPFYDDEWVPVRGTYMSVRKLK